MLIILAHDRCRVRHFNVTAYPTAAWTAQQVEAFLWETAPRYLLRDRDSELVIEAVLGVRGATVDFLNARLVLLCHKLS